MVKTTHVDYEAHLYKLLKVVGRKRNLNKENSKITHIQSFPILETILNYFYPSKTTLP